MIRGLQVVAYADDRLGVLRSLILECQHDSNRGRLRGVWRVEELSSMTITLPIVGFDIGASHLSHVALQY